MEACGFTIHRAHCAQLVLPHHDGLRTLRTLRKTQRPPSCVSYWSEATSGSQTDHELPPYGNRTLAHITHITQNSMKPRGYAISRFTQNCPLHYTHYTELALPTLMGSKRVTLTAGKEPVGPPGLV